MAEKIKFTDEEIIIFIEGLNNMKENYEDMIKKLNNPNRDKEDLVLKTFIDDTLSNINIYLPVTIDFIAEPNAVFDFSDGKVLHKLVNVYEIFLEEETKKDKHKNVLAKLRAKVDSLKNDFEVKSKKNDRTIN